MAATFLPNSTLQALVAALDGKLTLGDRTVPVETIGEKDFGDDDQLVLQLPAVRVRYDSSGFKQTTNSARVYSGEHLCQIWCAAENLRSNEAQRSDTLDLVEQVLEAIVGVRLLFPDATQTDPIRLLGISPLPDDNVGTLYIVSVAVGGSAQFPGGN